MMGWYGGGMGPLGWLAMGLFWLVLLGLIVWLVTRLLPVGSGGTTRPTGKSPLEILDRRLASGQLSWPPGETRSDRLRDVPCGRGSGGGGDRPVRIDAYPGYFTIDLKRNGEVSEMMSVNASG